MKGKSFERKAELLNAALDEFTQRSYEEASLNAIIKNAGISKGTFYYHFTDKQALYLFLMESASKAKWNFMNDRMKEHAANFLGKDIFESFKMQAKIGAEFSNAYPEYQKLSKMFLKGKGSPIYETVKNTFGSSSEAMLKDMVTKAVDNGDFRSDFSNEFLVKVVSHLLMNFDEVFHSEDDFEISKMVDNLNNYVDFMKSGLGRK